MDVLLLLGQRGSNHMGVLIESLNVLQDLVHLRS